MSEFSTEYKTALEYTKKFQPEPEGFSSFNTTNAADKVIIRQNNIIIRLLLSLHDKLDKLNTEKINLESDLSSLTNKLDNFDLVNLTNKLDNFSLRKSGKEKITSQKFLFPHQQ